MPFTLTNFQTTLSPALLLKAGKCTVRECDETSKGFYEAYVDEAKESYDVSLRLSPKNEVAEHHCDCGGAETFCRHKAALLLAIADKTKKPAAGKVVKGKAKAKQSKTDALLEAADADKLKAWVKELLDKNKDLALAFVQRFGEQKTAYTKADAEALTAEAVKSVVKSRTRVEQSELKKIVDLWTDVHRPIVEAYVGNVTHEDAFLAFHAVLDACNLFAQKVNATGQKISAYVENLLNQTVEPIAQLYSDETFEKATAFFSKYMLDEARRVRLHYVQHLQKILSLSIPERLAAGTEKLVKQYARTNLDKLVNGTVYTKMLFDFVERSGLLAKHLAIFEPITWDNSFNERLIGKLIEAGDLALAAKYAREQIAGNYREEYNLPYLEQLKTIYRLQKEEEKLAEVTAQLLPFTFDFDDYLFLYNRMPESEEKKKWRTKLINKAKNAGSYGRNGAKDFYFRLLDHEKSYKKMISSINSYTPYRLIVDYFEPMAATDKMALLKATIDKGDDYGWDYSQDKEEDEQQVFSALLEAMIKTYDKIQVLAAVKSAESGRFYYRGSRFIDYLKKEWAKC